MVDDEEFLFGDVNKHTRPFPLTATMDPRSMLEFAVYHVSLAHHGNRGFLPCGRKSLNDDFDVPVFQCWWAIYLDFRASPLMLMLIYRCTNRDSPCAEGQ